MKKLLVLLLSVMLCMLVFVSCGVPKSADDVMAKIDRKMDSLKSYQAEMTAKFSTVLNGYQCSADFSGQVIEINGKFKEYYYYDTMEGTTEIKDDKGGVLETVDMKALQAFNEGKMFVLTKQGDMEQKLYSALDKDDYIAYLEKQNNALDIDFNACVNKTFTKNEDKTWTVHYSGYTKSAIDELVEQFGADELFEEEIKDMAITIRANKDFTVKDMEIKLVFENESTTSDFRMTAQYSKYNEATPIVDTLNVNNYHEVADCRLLTDIEDMLETLEEAESGSFVLDLSQKLTYGVYAQTQKSSETDTVTYGKKNGKYFYTVRASYDGSDIDISYENGKQEISYSGGSQTANQTEDEAKAFINGLINTACYESIRVSNIEKIGEGTYKIVCSKPNENLYQPIFSSLGMRPTVNQTITVTIRDGKITKMESNLNASGFNVTYDDAEFELVSVITFN